VTLVGVAGGRASDSPLAPSLVDREERIEGGLAEDARVVEPPAPGAWIGAELGVAAVVMTGWSPGVRRAPMGPARHGARGSGDEAADEDVPLHPRAPGIGHWSAVIWHLAFAFSLLRLGHDKPLHQRAAGSVPGKAYPGLQCARKGISSLVVSP